MRVGGFTMEAVDGFLTAYGLLAACGIMVLKAAGVPVPVPGDVILLATAARAAEGKVSLSLAFVGLLLALVLGGIVQFLLARGPARRVLLRFGQRVGLTEARIERVAASVRRGGLFGIGVGVLTPGLRTAVIPACGLTNIPLRTFVPGLALGSALDVGLHFALGYAGAGLLATVLQASPVLLLIGLLAVGCGAWALIVRRRHGTLGVAMAAWEQATCPVCLVVGSLAPLETEPAVRWQGAH
jgi:membrane protein DedA with SNARE-associated domain